MDKKDLKLEEFSAIDRTDRWIQNWYTKYISDDPVVDLEQDLPIWRNRSRYLCYNNPVAKAPIQNIATLTIGQGIFPNPTPKISDRKKKKQVREAILRLYQEWADNANLDGITDLSSTLRQIVAAIFRDGDVLVYLSTDDSGNFKIDLIDASRIETPKGNKNSNIKLGIEIKKRTITKYWVKTNKGEKDYVGLNVRSSRGDILSILLKNPYNADMINSYRGIPALAPCLSTVEDLNSVLKDELRATKINRSKVGVVTTQGSNVSEGVESLADEVVGGIGYQRHGDLELLVMQAGDKLDLHGGSDVSNPNIPNIVKLYLKQIASVFNVPYNALYSDIDDNTYSTNQSILLEGWKATLIIQKYLIQNLLKPLYKLNLEKWVLEGKIPGVTEYSEELADVQFNGRPNTSIKAKDTYEAQEIAIKAGLKSVQMAALENGDDPWQIMMDKIEYEEEMRDIQNQKNVSSQGEEELKENDQILKIIEMFYSGKLSVDAAKNILMSLYKYTEEEVSKLIIVNSDAKEEIKTE